MFDQEILEDSRGFGKPLASWVTSREYYRDPTSRYPVKPLPPHEAKNFTKGVHVLLEIGRLLPVYRFFENQESEAQRLGRASAQIFGGWWTPTRPSDYMDQLGLPFALRESRRGLAVARGWNRFDGVVEARLVPGRKVYFGRASAQSETPHFPSTHYGGGSFQFLLASPSETVQFVRLYEVQ